MSVCIAPSPVSILIRVQRKRLRLSAHGRVDCDWGTHSVRRLRRSEKSPSGIAVNPILPSDLPAANSTPYTHKINRAQGEADGSTDRVEVGHAAVRINGAMGGH